jgi:hypothetical protein
MIKIDTSKRREKIKTEIVKYRDDALEAGFEYLGEMYPCDPVFQEAIKTYFMEYSLGLLNPEDTVKIRKIDNTFWYPNYSELLPFAGSLALHVKGIWDNYWLAKDAL